MNNQTILYVVVALFVGFVAWDKLIPRLKKLLGERKTQTQATAELIVAIDSLRYATNLLTTALASDESTKMLAGTLKACEAIAAATVELRDEVAAFGKLVRVDDKQYPAEQITQPPDTSADERVATFLDALTRGRSVSESMQQAKDEAETKTMFNAVTLDPTGGE